MCLLPTAWAQPITFSLFPSYAVQYWPLENLPCSLTLSLSSHMWFSLFLPCIPGKLDLHCLVSTCKLLALKTSQTSSIPMPRQMWPIFLGTTTLGMSSLSDYLLFYSYIFSTFHISEDKSWVLFSLHFPVSMWGKSPINTPWMNEWMNAWLNTGIVLARNIEAWSLGI